MVRGTIHGKQQSFGKMVANLLFQANTIQIIYQHIFYALHAGTISRHIKCILLFLIQRYEGAAKILKRGKQ